MKLHPKDEHRRRADFFSDFGVVDLLRNRRAIFSHYGRREYLAHLENRGTDEVIA